MTTKSKRPWVLTYFISWLIVFVWLSYDNYPSDKWLWSAFVFSVIGSPFTYFLGLVVIYALEEPYKWIKGILAKFRNRAK